MQKIMEPSFEIIYLVVGLVISIMILIHAHKRASFIVFGIMGLVLVFGDSFHLIPRIFNSWKLGGENIHIYLGIGKLITSITMTFFYILLYWFYKIRYHKSTSLYLDLSIYILSLVRIILCLLPFNEWTNVDPPYMWGIYRNIPFVILGIIMIIISYSWAKENKDKYFKYVYIAITLSFILYMMTVTLTVIHTLFGMMMLPKTICYVYILIMGLLSSKDKENINIT